MSDEAAMAMATSHPNPRQKRHETLPHAARETPVDAFGCWFLIYALLMREKTCI